MVELYKELKKHNISLEVRPIIYDDEGLWFHFRKGDWSRAIPISLKLMEERPVETEDLLLRTVELVISDYRRNGGDEK